MRRLVAVQYWLVLLTTCLFIATTAAIVGSVFWNWRFGLPTRDKTIIVNTVVATGAYVLVALTLIVALAAYVSANGRPDLSLEVTFGISHLNRPAFLVADNSELLPPLRQIGESKQTEGEVVISNSSRYAARNPGVRIRLDGLSGMANQSGWTTLKQENQTGVSELQWDGGADYIIHGGWSRTLPMLDVKGMYSYKSDPAFIVVIAADGFGPKSIRIPVEILDAEEYQKVHR